MNKIGLSSNLVCIKKFQAFGSFCFLRSKETQFWLSKSFFYVKNWRNLSDFLSLKNIKKEAQLLLLTYFHNFNFKCTLFSIAIVLQYDRKPKKSLLFTPNEILSVTSSFYALVFSRDFTSIFFVPFLTQYRYS